MGNCQERKVIDMTMTRKQHKALRRHKAIVREHNIRTNNLKYNPPLYVPGKSRSYRLYDI